jgi:hypothetical protein
MNNYPMLFKELTLRKGSTDVRYRMYSAYREFGLALSLSRTLGSTRKQRTAKYDTQDVVDFYNSAALLGTLLSNSSTLHSTFGEYTRKYRLRSVNSISWPFFL